jgi:hypothetical protein
MKLLSFDEVNLVSGAGNVNWELRILLQWAVIFRDRGQSLRWFTLHLNDFCGLS